MKKEKGRISDPSMHLPGDLLCFCNTEKTYPWYSSHPAILLGWESEERAVILTKGEVRTMHRTLMRPL